VKITHIEIKNAGAAAGKAAASKKTGTKKAAPKGATTPK
jgi:hypothetical protein